MDRTREWWFQKTHPKAPWLGPDAIRTLDRLLHLNLRGIECGAGRSTAWVAQRVAFLESWEENPDWHQRVEAQLAGQMVRNVTLKRVPQTQDTNWNYALPILQTAVPKPDFALIDSEHHRDVLALHFVQILQPGGFLMLDNANWFLPSASRAPHSRKPTDGPANEIWQQFAALVEDWECQWTSSGVTDTAFFCKPG